jgi:hypothetical protein
MKRKAEISRYILLALIIFVSSIVIPKYFWLMFAKNIRAPHVYYSPVAHDFVLAKIVNKKYLRFGPDGKQISRYEFERLTPFFSFRQLLFRGELGDTIAGVPIKDYKEIRKNNIYLNLKPKDIYYYQINLYPLFESRPDGPELKMPEEFFRINKKFEFINCETNEVEKELSERFDKALYEHGFAFPAQKYFGNPTNMKPFDYGYFILDSEGKLFHLMRIHNKPYVKEVKLPKGVSVEYILVQELELDEFYGILVTKDNRLFLILKKGYKIVPLPVKHYDRTKMKVLLTGNMVSRTISLIAKDSLLAFVTDRNYKLIATYKTKWTANKDRPAGKIFAALTPFTLSMDNDNTSFIDFNFKFHGYKSLIVNLLAVLLAVFFVKKYREGKVKEYWFDYLIVLITGIYGLIALLLVRKES